MAKILRCADLIPGCDFIARGKSGDEAVARAIEHVRGKHHLRAVSPEILAYLVSAVREERVRAAGSAA